MNADYEKIQDILTELTDVFNYDDSYYVHRQAYDIAFKKLCKVIDIIKDIRKLRN